MGKNDFFVEDVSWLVSILLQGAFRVVNLFW